MTRRGAYLVLALTLLAGAGVLSGWRPAAIAGGLLLAFVLPGAALSGLLSRDAARLTTVERVVLVPAFSLGTLLAGGLVAWGLGAPLHRTTWLAVSAAVAIGGAVATVVKPAPATQREPAPPTRVRGRLFRQLVPATLAVVLLAAGTWLSLTSSLRSHQTTITALSVAPPGATDPTGQRSVAVRASGLDAGPEAYAVVVTSAAGAQPLRYPVTADARGDWATTLQLPAADRLTLGLYRAGQTAALRTVIIAAATH